MKVADWARSAERLEGCVVSLNDIDQPESVAIHWESEVDGVSLIAWSSGQTESTVLLDGNVEQISAAFLDTDSILGHFVRIVSKLEAK
jgi:hypothetical protein